MTLINLTPEQLVELRERAQPVVLRQERDMTSKQAYQESLTALDALNRALTAAGVPFHLAGFEMVEDAGHPTFKVRMTTTQAKLLTEALHEIGK